MTQFRTAKLNVEFQILKSDVLDFARAALVVILHPNSVKAAINRNKPLTNSLSRLGVDRTLALFKEPTWFKYILSAYGWDDKVYGLDEAEEIHASLLKHADPDVFSALSAFTPDMEKKVIAVALIATPIVKAEPRPSQKELKAAILMLERNGYEVLEKDEDQGGAQWLRSAGKR